jgi:hypothetical protein
VNKAEKWNLVKAKVAKTIVGLASDTIIAVFHSFFDDFVDIVICAFFIDPPGIGQLFAFRIASSIAMIFAYQDGEEQDRKDQ